MTDRLVLDVLELSGDCEGKNQSEVTSASVVLLFSPEKRWDEDGAFVGYCLCLLNISGFASAAVQVESKNRSLR